MHSSRLSEHPRITVHTDGGQSTGLFYVNGPVDYANKAAQVPLDDDARTSAWVKGTLEGEAEIVFSMEGVAALALEPGDNDEIVTLRGPLNGDDTSRLDEIVRQWFENPDTVTTLSMGQVQVKREDLRWLWRNVLVDDIKERVEALDDSDDLIGALRALTGLRQQLGAD